MDDCKNNLQSSNEGVTKVIEKGYVSTAIIRPIIEYASIRSFAENFDFPIKIQRIIKQLRDPENRVSISDLDYLTDYLIEKTNNEALCVQPPHKFNSQSSCQLQHLFLCSNTLREALYYMEKFSSILSDFLEIVVTRTREGIIKIKLPVSDQAIQSTHRHRTELTISILLNWMRQLCGSNLNLIGINVPFPMTRYHHQYEQQWKTKITFNSSECCLLINSKWLDEGLHKTNPNILNMMKKEVEDQYRKLARSGSLSDRIRKALMQEKIPLNANQKSVASYFHISARTLNRHLHRESTSLKQIITQVRLESAKRLLTNTNSPIEQIALQLGLSGRRTLDRIFIKETNQSPAQYRQAKQQPQESVEQPSLYYS